MIKSRILINLYGYARGLIENIVDSAKAQVPLPILLQTEHTALVAIRDRAEPHVLLTSNSIDKADSTFVLEGFWNPAKYLLDLLHNLFKAQSYRYQQVN